MIWPLTYLNMLGLPSRMFFGHNLRYMAPFGIPRTGFYMVFQRASFVFMPRDDFLSPGSDFGMQGRHFGPGTFLESKPGHKKSDFVMEWFCHCSSGEIPRPKWILLYIGPIWAGYFVPKPPYLIIFKGFPIFRKTGERPGSPPLYIPYSSLWDPYSLSTPDIPLWAAAMW